jgi:acyl-coenzyme A thioesterase PaaI-like protein
MATTTVSITIGGLAPDPTSATGVAQAAEIHTFIDALPAAAAASLTDAVDHGQVTVNVSTDFGNPFAS